MGNTVRRRTSANRLTRHPLAMACAAAFLLASQAGFAQDATTEPQTDAEKAEAAKKKDGIKELESVKVTGIRRGIENAIEAKQTANSILESISAEDIGKLPDSSIAESIARLPGLTAQRERGRATQINIRGLSGDFAGTTLNGREQTSTGDNRGVEFDQYPSELLSSVLVYKTPTPSLVGQGLSGTIDLKTVRPLDFEERVASANFRFDQNKVNGQNEYGNRYSFAYIDQFADRTVGLAIGYAHMDSPQPGFQNESWGYPCNGQGQCITGGGKVYKFDNNNERDGLMATLQFKPNDFYETTLDVFVSKFKKTEVKSGVEFGTVWGTAGDPLSYELDGDTVVHSTWDNVTPVIRMDSNPIDDRLHSYGWNNRWTFADNWTVTADLSHSDTKREFQVLETYAGITTPNGRTTLEIDLDPSGDFSNYTFGVDLNDPANLRLIDAGGWGQDGYLKDFEITDRLNAMRLAASRSFDEGWLSSIDFGFNRSDRTKSKSSLEAKLCLDACEGGDSAPYPGSPSDLQFSGLNGLAGYDADELLASGIYNLQPKFHPDIAGKNWDVDETLDTYYLQFNVDTDLGEMPLRGNFGFQYVHAEQESSGYSTYSGNSVGDPVDIGTSYSDFLPSINLALEVKPDTFIRFAAAKQVQRPRMDDLRATLDVGICNDCDPDGPIWKGTGGNPLLRPWKSNAYDLSVEKYFTTAAGNKGYVAAAYFFKDLTTYIYKSDTEIDFAGYPLPPPTQGQLNYPSTTVGLINQPINGEGGVLKGLELTVSVPLDVLWSGLNGFGVQASYSDTTTSIHPNGPGTSEPLPGFSKYVSNVTAYYEHAGFSVRFSQRKRSGFRGETRGFGADLTYDSYNPETVQDAQVNYTFGDGTMLHGLSLYLQVSNIGDEPFTASQPDDPERRPLKYFEYGRTTLLGFSYKF